MLAACRRLLMIAGLPARNPEVMTRYIRCVPGFHLLFSLLLLASLASCASSSDGSVPTAKPHPVSYPVAATTSEEFVGPFPSWLNVRHAPYNAAGNGTADDTQVIQAALDAVGKTPTAPAVVYLPAGTYRITHTLTMATRQNIAVIGADPKTTKIQWGGPSGQDMLYLNGVGHSKFERLSLDGAASGGGTALTGINQGWDGKVRYADSGNLYSDLYITNTGYGIRLGTLGYMGSETEIRRCRFVDIAYNGIDTENFNTLDVWVWDCFFERNHFGVANYNLPPSGARNGAGDFRVYTSIFRSNAVDITYGNAGFFTIRGNYSIGSGAFFLATALAASSPTLLEKNTIIDPNSKLNPGIDPKTPPIEDLNTGPLLMVDNTIRAIHAALPVVSKDGYIPPAGVDPNTASDLIAVGNTYVTPRGTSSIPTCPTAAHAVHGFFCEGRIREIDTRFTPVSKFSVPIMPVLPSAPPNLHRRIFEVPAGASTNLIQSIIRHASSASLASDRARPIVHFAPATYTITQTLTVPARARVQLVGDGWNSQLFWGGHSTSAHVPLLDLRGPSRTTLRDLYFLESNDTTADLIHVDHADQPDGRVFGDGLYNIGRANLANQTLALITGLDQSRVEFQDYQESQTAGTGMRVIGGPMAGSGGATLGRVTIFDAGDAQMGSAFSVVNGGKLLVADAYYEGPEPGYLNLAGAGTFVLSGGKIGTLDGTPYTAGPGSQPAVSVNGFNGRVVLLNQSMFGGKIALTGDGSHLEFLGLGLLNGDVQPDNGVSQNYYFDSTSPAARALFLAGRHRATTGDWGVPGSASPTVVDQNRFVLKMLAELRTWAPTSNFRSIPAGKTNVRMFNVGLESANDGSTNIRITSG